MDRSQLNIQSLMLTPLSAYGLVVLLAIALFMAVSTLQSAASDKAERLVEAKSELQTLNQLQTTNIWESRLLESQVINADVKRRLWAGATEGVIAAKIEQALRSAAQEVAVVNMRVNVDSVPTTIGGINVLAFELTGAVPAVNSPVDIMNDIVSQEQSLVIQDMSFTLDARAKNPSMFNMSGFAPVAVEPASSVSGAQ